MQNRMCGLSTGAHKKLVFKERVYHIYLKSNNLSVPSFTILKSQFTDLYNILNRCCYVTSQDLLTILFKYPAAFINSRYNKPILLGSQYNLEEWIHL